MLLGGLSAVLLSALASAEQMRVTSDSVNVRSGPGTRYEPVGQVNSGDVVTTRQSADGWSEIAPPDDARLWVYGDLLDGVTVAATRIQVRSGPGISYRPVGTLDRGREVTIAETSGEWVRIVPPETVSVWVSSQFLTSALTAPAPVKVATQPSPEPPVAIPPPAVPAPPKAEVRSSSPGVTVPPPAAAPRSEAVAPPRRSDPGPGMELPAALIGRQLAEGKDQGDTVELSGVLRSSGVAWGKLSPYRLVGKDARGRTVTLCYVLGNSAQLASIEGRRVTIEGQRYWVQRVRYPGVRPERIRVLR